jgi:glycosyltransferase involved in cell wall biosynthesis
VAGRMPPPSVLALERLPGVKVLGYVERLESFLDEISMGVIPLWEGPGIKVKTLTFFAAGVPVAATPVGLEGVPAVHARHCMIAEDPSGLAGGLRAIAGDRGLAETLAEESRRLVADAYTPERVGPRFVAAVELAVRGAPT